MSDQTLIAISGKKSSGKNTVCNFIHSLAIVHLGISESAQIDPDSGEMVVLRDDGQLGVFDLSRRDPEFVQFLYEKLYPTIRKFSFADLLKEIAVDLLDLSEQQVYGSNDDKNTLTNYKWEDMPVPPSQIDKKTRKVTRDKTGFMTAREILQFVGTDLLRSMNYNVWADATIRRIKRFGTPIAILDDCRFPNEVSAVQNAGGKVIRLTRNIYPDDTHPSETALDPDVFDWQKFDAVVDNQNLSIEQTNEQIFNLLVQWEVVSV